MDRVVHGSDLPIPVVAFWLGVRGEIPLSRARAIDKQRNPLERDVELKRTLGFPDTSFTLLAKLLELHRPMQ